MNSRKEQKQTPKPKNKDENSRKPINNMDLFNSKKLSRTKIHAHVDTAKGTATDQLALAPSDRRGIVFGH